MLKKNEFKIRKKLRQIIREELKKINGFYYIYVDHFNYDELIISPLKKDNIDNDLICTEIKDNIIFGGYNDEGFRKWYSGNSENNVYMQMLKDEVFNIDDWGWENNSKLSWISKNYSPSNIKEIKETIQFVCENSEADGDSSSGFIFLNIPHEKIIFGNGDNVIFDNDGSYWEGWD